MADTSQSPQTDQIVVRPAREQDRDAVLAFCADTWPDGDYVPYVWDRWLRDERGVLLVAAVGERPVGIVHVKLLSEDESWLEGIRVDPRERRQGIGRMLLSRALVTSRERGAAVARLITDGDNDPAQGLFAAFGFTRVAEIVRYRADALSPESLTRLAEDSSVEPLDDGLSALASGPLPPTPENAEPDGAQLTAPGLEEFEHIWAWLVQSNLAPLNGGLEFAHWTARALAEPQLRRYLAEGRVLLLEEWQTILALAVLRDVPARGDNPAALEIVYMDGLSEAIGRMALVLREIAGERRQTQVVLWLPNLLILHDAMDGAGYEADDGPMFVCSRTL